MDIYVRKLGLVVKERSFFNCFFCLMKCEIRFFRSNWGVEYGIGDLRRERVILEIWVIDILRNVVGLLMLFLF